MARFSTTLKTDAPAQRVLDHLADFATAAEWDPGVTAAALLSGDPGQVGARYRVMFSFGPRRIPLEYVVMDRRDPLDGEPGYVVLVAESGWFTSHDTITVTPTSSGSEMRYDAILTLHGLGRIMDWPLHQSFQVIGRTAEQGLREALATLATEQDTRTE
jgi:hypothetical protein